MKIFRNIILVIVIGLIILRLNVLGIIPIKLKIDDVYILASLVVILSFYFEYKINKLKIYIYELYKQNEKLKSICEENEKDIQILKHG